MNAKYKVGDIVKHHHLILQKHIDKRDKRNNQVVLQCFNLKTNEISLFATKPILEKIDFLYYVKYGMCYDLKKF